MIKTIELVNYKPPNSKKNCLGFKYAESLLKVFDSNVEGDIHLIYKLCKKDFVFTKSIAWWR